MSRSHLKMRTCHSGGKTRKPEGCSREASAPCGSTLVWGPRDAGLSLGKREVKAKSGRGSHSESPSGLSACHSWSWDVGGATLEVVATGL